MRFLRCFAGLAVWASLAACGLTANSPSDESGGTNSGGTSGSGSESSGGSSSGGSGGSGGSCDPCDVPDPDLNDRFHPRELASGLAVRSIQERSLEPILELTDQVLAAQASTVLLSAEDGVYRFAFAELEFIRAHSREDGFESVLESLYPHEGGAFLIDYEDPNLAEPGPPEVPTETKVVDLSWDGTMSESDAGQDRTPQGVEAMGTDGYLLADGGIFPLGSPSEVVAGSQSSTWSNPSADHQGRLFRFGYPDGTATVQGIDPLGVLATLSAVPPAEVPVVWSITSCDDDLLLQGNQLWSLNPETGETHQLDSGGTLDFLEGISGRVPTAVSCNSWAAFWFTAGAEPGSGVLKMLLLGEDTPRVVADGLDTRGLFATEDDLYWLSPGDGDGALWNAPLAELQP